MSIARHLSALHARRCFRAAHALEIYEEAKGLKVTKELDDKVWSSLLAESGGPVLMEYVLTDQDVEGPFFPNLPKDYGELAKLKAMGYRNPSQKIGAMFHMGEDLFFPSISRRIIAFNARKVYRPDNKIQQILLAIEDVTERARLECEHAAAHERIGMLLQELTHRVKNSLQFIASMVRFEARSSNSGEANATLERVSHRITALGELYSKLSKADTVEAVDAATDLDELCCDLIASVHKEEFHVHRAQDRHRKRAPADR